MAILALVATYTPQPVKQDWHNTKSFALVQINQDPEERWVPGQAEEDLEEYLAMSLNLQEDVIIWPEVALGYLWDEELEAMLKARLRSIENQRGSKATLIAGFNKSQSLDNAYFNQAYTNELVLIDSDENQETQLHSKKKLVFFGEYTPPWLVDNYLVQQAQIPYSSIVPGDDSYSLMQLGDWKIAPSICYETDYPATMRDYAAGSDVIVSINEDGWFLEGWGTSIRLLSARARAIESGRYLLRATNSGTTAIIDPQGQVLKSIGVRQKGVIAEEIPKISGSSYYFILGDWPNILICVVSIFFAGAAIFRRRLA